MSAISTTKKAFQILLIASFFLVFFTPAVQMMLTKKSYFSFTEKRSLAEFPIKPQSLGELPTFLSAIDKYLDDHFGFRDFLIYRYQREVRKRFGITGNQTIVHQGTDNWFFLGQSEMMFDFAGKNRLSKIELNSWIKSYFRKKLWLAGQGIQYLLVVPPNKQTIYPEFVMRDWQKIHGQSRLKQLQEVFSSSHPEEFLDLTSVLRNKKHTGLLYYQSGTHWTPSGAYYGYIAMAEKIERFFPEIRFERDFNFTEPIARRCASQKDTCGDLTKMLLDFTPFEEAVRQRKSYDYRARRRPFTLHLSGLPNEPDRPSIIKKCQGKQLKAVVFRDSFFTALDPYFSENFSQVVYLWKSYDKKNMEEILKVFKPDIVIEEIVERNVF